jgi:hypothetical protein
MSTERQRLYEYMRSERVNVEIMFPRLDDEEFVITCRFREWAVGRNAGRMILAGGRTVDEAIAYAYVGLLEGTWVPMDWRARAPYIGTVARVSETPTPIRRPLDVQSLFDGQPELFPIDDGLSPVKVPQKGAQRGPQRNSTEDKA